MSDEDDKKNAIDYFTALVEAQGVACLTVSDGHVLMFKRTWLENLLKAYPDKPEILIQIKRPDFNQ